jgi:hypothetical protein
MWRVFKKKKSKPIGILLNNPSFAEPVDKTPKVEFVVVKAVYVPLCELNI